MNQPNLFQPAPDTVDLRPSHVRSVSVAAYQQLKDSGTLAAREVEFLEALEAFSAKYGKAPTLRELVDWSYRSGRIQTADPNYMRPRSSEMVARGVCEYLPVRQCRVSRRSAAPIRVRQV